MAKKVKIVEMEKGRIPGRTAEKSLDNGKMATYMVKHISPGLMDLPMKACAKQSE